MNTAQVTTSREESNLVGSAPLSRCRQHSELDEATAPKTAKVHTSAGQPNVPGHFNASVPLNGAMRDCRPGEYVICSEVDPADGDVVLAFVFRTRLDDLDAEGEGRYVFRRYGHKSSGAVTLTPDDPSFAAWTEGTKGSVQTEFIILGVRTEEKGWDARE